MKDIPEGGRAQLQYGYATAKDSVTHHNYTFQTKGTCTNQQAAFAVYVRDKNRVSKSQDSCVGLHNIEASWFHEGKVTHYHTASSNMAY